MINERNQKIETVAHGSVEQLKQVVEFVANGDVVPPPHTEFSVDETATMMEKLCQSELPGRAVIRFRDIQ